MRKPKTKPFPTSIITNVVLGLVVINVAILHLRVDRSTDLADAAFNDSNKARTELFNLTHPPEPTPAPTATPNVEQ